MSTTIPTERETVFKKKSQSSCYFVCGRLECAREIDDAMVPHELSVGEDPAVYKEAMRFETV